MKKTLIGVALLMVLAISGCANSGEPGTEVSEAPSLAETQTSEAADSPTLSPLEDVMAAFLTPADLSPIAVSGTPSQDALDSGFFGDIPDTALCSDSQPEALEGFSALVPLASQILKIDQELPAYIIQWAFSADSAEAADYVVQQFDEKYLSASCYESLDKGFTEKVDMAGALPEGSKGVFWVDNTILSGDVISQIRGISSVGQLVYFSYSVANDNPESAIVPDELSRLSGEGMVRFLQGF